MTDKNNNWQLLTTAYNPGLNEILLQQYFGAQFIAITGRHLIKQRDDDSNTSMVYDRVNRSLIGEILPHNFRLTLNLPDLSLSLLKNDSAIYPTVSLAGLTRIEAFTELSHLLEKEGLNIGHLKNELHYDLPDHELKRGSLFRYDQPDLIQENMAYRHNAEVVLKQIVSSHPLAEPVKIWPHHFDTGTLIPLNRDGTGELTQSAGLGWAIPDGMVDEPYFYLSIWSGDPLEFPEKMPLLEAGNWMMPGWNGAVLRLSEILLHHSPKEQYEYAISFFKAGLQVIQELIN